MQVEENLYSFNGSNGPGLIATVTEGTIGLPWHSALLAVLALMRAPLATLRARKCLKASLSKSTLRPRSFGVRSGCHQASSSFSNVILNFDR